MKVERVISISFEINVTSKDRLAWWRNCESRLLAAVPVVVPPWLRDSVMPIEFCRISLVAPGDHDTRRARRRTSGTLPPQRRPPASRIHSRPLTLLALPHFLQIRPRGLVFERAVPFSIFLLVVPSYAMRIRSVSTCSLLADVR